MATGIDSEFSVSKLLNYLSDQVENGCVGGLNIHEVLLLFKELKEDHRLLPTLLLLGGIFSNLTSEGEHVSTQERMTPAQRKKAVHFLLMAMLDSISDSIPAPQQHSEDD